MTTATQTDQRLRLTETGQELGPATSEQVAASEAASLVAYEGRFLVDLDADVVAAQEVGQPWCQGDSVRNVYVSESPS